MLPVYQILLMTRPWLKLQQTSSSPVLFLCLDELQKIPSPPVQILVETIHLYCRATFAECMF